MNDAIQWFIDLIKDDVSLMIGGIVVLSLAIEGIARFREWIRKAF